MDRILDINKMTTKDKKYSLKYDAKRVHWYIGGSLHIVEFLDKFVHKKAQRLGITE